MYINLYTVSIKFRLDWWVLPNFFILFYLYINPSDSQESNEGANT